MGETRVLHLVLDSELNRDDAMIPLLVKATVEILSPNHTMVAGIQAKRIEKGKPFSEWEDFTLTEVERLSFAETISANIRPMLLAEQAAAQPAQNDNRPLH